MLVYVEYFSRRPGIELSDFHNTVAAAQAEWGSGYSEDQLVLHAGRTWRLGPEPEYFTVWYSPNARFERLDEWDRVFRTPEGAAHASFFARVARIDVAGCYEPLLEPVPGRGRIYYVEFFRTRQTASAVRSLYERRRTEHKNFTLNLLIQRIGKLAPDPGGVAVWTIPDFASLAEITRELDEGDDLVVEPVAAGAYAPIGAEIL
jgi:hypothetical protein